MPSFLLASNSHNSLPTSCCISCTINMVDKHFLHTLFAALLSWSSRLLLIPTSTWEQHGTSYLTTQQSSGSKWLTNRYSIRVKMTLKLAQDNLKVEDKEELDLHGEIIPTDGSHTTSVTSATKVVDLDCGNGRSLSLLTRSGWSVYSPCWASSISSATGVERLGRTSIEVLVSLLGYQTGDKEPGYSVSMRAVYHLRIILGDKH
jgi:hypothetical protein